MIRREWKNGEEGRCPVGDEVEGRRLLSWSWSLWSQPIRAVVWAVWCRTWPSPFLVSMRLWDLPKSWSKYFYWLIEHFQTDSISLGTSNLWSFPSSSLTLRPLVTPFGSFPSPQFWRKPWVSSALWVESLVPWSSRWVRIMVVLCQMLIEPIIQMQSMFGGGAPQEDMFAKLESMREIITEVNNQFKDPVCRPTCLY